jgi:glucose/arabinose dehydrogenase
MKDQGNTTTHASIQKRRWERVERTPSILLTAYCRSDIPSVMQYPVTRVARPFVVVAVFVLVSTALLPQPTLAQIQEFETNTHRIRVGTVAEGLDSPWSMVFLPDGDMLVTERPGRLRLIRDGVLQDAPIAGVPEVQDRNHGGLMHVTLHPDFEANNWIYLTYSKVGEEGGTTAVMRARFDGTQLLDAEDIFVADAWQGAGLNFGSRVVFDNEGMLYASVGDRGPNTEPLAQDLGNHNGTIVRLHDDGRIPDDNPFVGQAGARPEIYSYGHRNPQGMAVHPETGEIWASEHGPMGGDEVNIIRAGANYGWPVVSYGRTYGGDLLGGPLLEGMDAPRYFWVPSIGISGLLFYTGDRFPEWTGELFVTGMNSMMIQRVRLEGRGATERELLLTQLRQQVRDIQQGPDGLIYLVTRQDGNRTPNSGMVLKIEPVE